MSASETGSIYTKQVLSLIYQPGQSASLLITEKPLLFTKPLSEGVQ